LAAEVVSMTKIVWESQRCGDLPYSRMTAKGYIRIPLKPLAEIIQEHPSFVARICEPPCQVQIFVEGKPSSQQSLPIQLGKAVEIGAEASVASWVQPHIRKKCKVTLEFCCARANIRTTKDNGTADLQPPLPRDYVWSGKLSQEFRMNGCDADGTMKHRIKIAFVESGAYYVSGCARIRREGMKRNVEEVWFAPNAASIVVEKISIKSTW